MPTQMPTKMPTKMPTQMPTKMPTQMPTKMPSTTTKMPTTKMPTTKMPSTTTKMPSTTTKMPTTKMPTSVPKKKSTIMPTKKAINILPTTMAPKNNVNVPLPTVTPTSLPESMLEDIAIIDEYIPEKKQLTNIEELLDADSEDIFETDDDYIYDYPNADYFNI